MKHVGIICEYNPFHAGHAYLLEQVREAECVVCMMSGNFTQRGEAAVLPAHLRAEMALAAGADLVLELPFPFAAGSARHFATAGVRGLSALGVDTLAFGSESADGALLREIAKQTLTEEFNGRVAVAAKGKGEARVYFDALSDTRLPPNDILGVEYVRAILEGGERIEIKPVRRIGAGYHDKDTSQSFPSATGLREKLAGGEDITPDLPQCVQEVWQKAIAQGLAPADTAGLGSAMLARLRAESEYAETGRETRFSDIAECEGGLGAHLARAALEATDYRSLCRAAATKQYTDGRIRRALLYLLAGVKRCDLLAPPAYLRLLAANERGRAFLAKTRKTRTVPVVTKPADVAALGDAAVRARALAAICDGLYALCLPRPILPTALATQPPVML